jgi:hypothetical protein
MGLTCVDYMDLFAWNNYYRYISLVVWNSLPNYVVFTKCIYSSFNWAQLNLATVYVHSPSSLNVSHPPSQNWLFIIIPMTLANWSELFLRNANQKYFVHYRTLSTSSECNAEFARGRSNSPAMVPISGRHQSSKRSPISRSKWINIVIIVPCTDWPQNTGCILFHKKSFSVQNVFLVDYCWSGGPPSHRWYLPLYPYVNINIESLC